MKWLESKIMKPKLGEQWHFNSPITKLLIEPFHLNSLPIIKKRK